MISVRVTGGNTWLKQAKGEADFVLGKIAEDVLQVARSNTPIRLGRARRGWKKSKNNKGYTVSNRVPYINKLDQGSSKQAPQGIVKPTIDEISRRRY